ncbi:MAG: DegV family protein [Ruminococcus bromii]|nr:DegV family protein [Ruminococcus bromii]
MSRIAVVTDTNSGITREEAKKLGVFLLPMPIIVDGKEYFEGVTCTYEQFFDMLAAGSDVSTSQPAPEDLTALWDTILQIYDSIVHIPMSSALSGSCGTAKALAADYNGRVCVVDNKRISLSQRESVLDALTLIKKGLTAAEICVQLEETAYNSSIYLAVNTLELLKKSGRVTAAGAALATLLGLKPVLQIQGEKLDAYAKVRGMAAAEKTMLKAIEKDMQTRFAGKPVHIAAAYSGDIRPALEWRKTVRSYFGDSHIELYKLPISICCHVGAGVKAIACYEYFE